MTQPARIRRRILEALRDKPLVSFREDHAGVVDRPDADLAFEDLGMDSLARMELSIWVEVEFGLELTEAEIRELKSVNGLAAFVAGSGSGA